jgi:hypothetical protein
MENDQQPEIKKVPFYRMIMDDFMLLLFLGVTIYAIFTCCGVLWNFQFALDTRGNKK